jgi:hypothetical protein
VTPDAHDQHTVPHPVERFPARAPRGSWPAEEYAAAQRTQGTTDARAVMDLDSEQFPMVTDTTE